MKINIKEIERISSVLLSLLRENYGNDIELNFDYYWELSDEEMYNPYKEPKDITLGQLTFDLEELNRILENKDEAVLYDLKRLSSILNVLSSIEKHSIFPKPD